MTATLEFSPNDKVGRGRLIQYRRPWTLCLGAGINRGVMPDWSELAGNLTSSAFKSHLDKSQFKKIQEQSTWSFDAWIQYALNAFESSGVQGLDDFVAALRAELYIEIDKRQNSDALGLSITDAIGSLRGINRPTWETIASFFDRHFATTSAYRLAKMLADRPEFLPDSVINFNADTVFETIFNINAKIRHNATLSNWSDPPQTFVRYVRPSQDIEERIPIYHLHGCLAPSQSSGRPVPLENANLIFQEKSYTDMAGQVFTWSQNIFLHKASHNILCFVGISMSDPNIRRWLSWSQSAYISSLKSAYNVDTRSLSGRHIWIHSRRDLSIEAQKLYPIALKHLGIQICWLDNWDELPAAMRSLLETTV